MKYVKLDSVMGVLKDWFGGLPKAATAKNGGEYVYTGSTIDTLYEAITDDLVRVPTIDVEEQ